MSRNAKFEDIAARRKGRELTRDTYAHRRPGPFAGDFGMRDQIQRASVSSTSNITEGFDRGGDKEFIQFPSVSKGPCGEIKSHPYVAPDENYGKQDQFKQLDNKADEVSRVRSGFMAYLSKSDLRGRKFK
jgi:four helix bundle protein